MDFIEETLLDLLFLGQPSERADSLPWFSAMRRAVFTHFWLTNSVTCFQFNLLAYCFTMGLSLIFCSQILQKAVHKMKVLLYHKSFCFCFWTSKKFKIVRLIASCVRASVSWLTHFRLISLMLGGPSNQTSLTRCSTSKSVLQSDPSSTTRRHTSKSTAPVSPNMKPTQLRRALQKILSKGKIQRPQSSKDSRSDKHSVRDTTDLRSQKRRARQSTMPVVIDKFKGVMCLVPDHFEDQLTFSQGDEPGAVHSRVRKLTAQHGRVVQIRETTEGSDTEGNLLSSKMGNETSITSVTVEEATTDLMSGNMRVIRHKYVTQTETSSARAVQPGSFVKMSRENPLFSSCAGDTTVSSSEGETIDRARTKFKNEDSSDPQQRTSQLSAQCCPGLYDIPVLGEAERVVAQSSRVAVTGTRRRREKRKEIDLRKENEQRDVRSVSEQDRKERKRKTFNSKTKRRTGPQLADGESSTYVKGGETAVSEKYNKSFTRTGRDENKKLTCAKASASDSFSSTTAIGEVAISKSSQELCSKNLSTPSHFEHDSSNYQHNITSTPLIKSRGKLEHLNVSGFPDSLQSAERAGVGILTKETSKPLDTTPKSEDYPRWGSETLSDRARKKALYGAPEAKPPPGKPSPRKTLHEKELSDKMVTDFKPSDNKLRTNFLAETAMFSKCSRAKLRPTESSTDFKLTSIYPTHFMSVFGKKNVFEDYISSEQRQLSKVISGLKYDVTSLMPTHERFPSATDAPNDVSTPVSGLKPDITKKVHPQSTDENPTAGTIANLKRENSKEKRKKAVMTVDSKVVQFDLLGDGGRRVSEADQILNDAESIITTTAEDTKCYPEPGYRGPSEYEALQARRQKATGAIRNKIGVRKYQPYTNPRLVKNEAVFGQHRWFSSTALTQSSSSMKETKSSNETKDEIIEETGGDAWNEAPLKGSTWKGDNGMTETNKRSTKQHPHFMLSRPRIGQNCKEPCETNGQESSTDEKELKSVKRCKTDPVKDDKPIKKIPKTYSTDSSSDHAHPPPWRMKVDDGVKRKRSVFSTANIRMIEALPEENLEPPEGGEKSSRGEGAEEGQRKVEQKKAFNLEDKDRVRPLYKNDQQRDIGMGSNSTLSASKQTTVSKRQSDEVTSCASKKQRKVAEKDNRLESKQVGFKSKVTRHVVSETLTSPRIAKGDEFKPRVAKTEGDLVELRKRRENKLNSDGLSHTRLTGEKANTVAGVTIRKRIKKILSSNKDNVDQPAQEVNGRSKVSRIPIYVGASLTKSLSAVNNRRGAGALAHNATRSLTNHAGEHHAMVSKDVVARQSHLKVSGSQPFKKVSTTAAQNSGHDFTRKCSAHRLDKKRTCEEARCAKPVESDLKMCQHFEENKSTFGQLTLTGADQELKAVLPMLIDHSKDSIIIITPDTKIKQLTSIIDKVGQIKPGGPGPAAGLQVKKRGHEEDVGNADARKALHDTCTAHGMRHQRISVPDEKGRALKSFMARDGVYDQEGDMVGSSFSGSAVADDDLHAHIANKRLRHICSPEACRLCGTHTQDNTTCEMGKVDQMTSHQQYTMNTQKLLFRRTLTRQDNLKVPYDYEDAAVDMKDGQINEYFIMHDAYRVFKRRKSPVVTKEDLTVGYVNDKNVQSDDDQASGINSPLSSSLKVRKERCHQQTRLPIDYEDLVPGKTKKRKKKSNTSIKSSESRAVRSLGMLSPVQVKTETLLPGDAKNDDDESDVIQVVTYEDYHCRSESTTAPPGESPRIMSSPVPGYQRNTRSYSMKIAKESPQKVGNKPAHSDYIIDPEVQHYRISRITKRKNPNPANEVPAKHEFGANVPAKQLTQDRQSKYRTAMSVKKPAHVPAKQTRGTVGGKANLATRFDEDEKKVCRAQGKHNHHEMFTESRDRHRKEAQAIPDDRKYGEILHKAGETSRAWAKMKSGEAPKVRETRLKQVSGTGHHQADVVVDKSRQGTRQNIDRTARKTADVTMDPGGRKLYEPSAASRGRRAPKESHDCVVDGTIEKNDSESLRVNPFYLKRNFAKLKNPFTTITRQRANLRVLDELENKQHVHYEPKPYSDDPKPRQRVDFAARDPANSFLKGSVDKQTDNLLKGSATGTANFDRITCIPSTVRVKQTKTSLQRQRSSHLHHDISQYMNFAWQADEKVTNQRNGQNNLTSSRAEDNGRSFDDGKSFVSSPYPTDQKFYQKDTMHTLPRETSPRTRRKNTDSSGDHIAEQATSNVMFVSNKSPRKTHSQIREPKQKSPSYQKNPTDYTKSGRVHYRNGRRVLPREANDTAALIDTHSSNIEISRDNGPTKDFDYSTTMPSTEAEMLFHKEPKPRKKSSEKSKKNKVSRRGSNHVLGSTTRKFESNSKTVHSMTSEPKSWGLNKQRIAQNVRAVLSSADFEKVWKRIETTKSETGVISSEDQRWIVNQLLLGGKESVPKSNSEPRGGDVTELNDSTYKMVHDKPHKPSRDARDGANEAVPKAVRKNVEKTAKEVAKEKKQKKVARSPPENTDNFSDGRKNGKSSLHSNPTALVLTGQKLYGNSMSMEMSDRKANDELSREMFSDVGAQRAHQQSDAWKKLLHAKETEAATRSENTLDDVSHDQTNTFPGRQKRKSSFADGPDEAACVRSESQKYLKTAEHLRSTALSTFIDDISTWVGHSRKSKLQKTMSSHFSQPVQSVTASTSNVQSVGRNTEDAAETIDVDNKPELTEDITGENVEEEDAVNSAPKPDKPFRSPKSITAVGNAANLFTQAWKKKSSSVLEINLGTIEEEVAFPKSPSPAQMNEKISAAKLFDTAASKAVTSNSAGETLSHSKMNEIERRREKMNEAAISLLEECLLRSASSARSPTDANVHQSAKGPAKGQAASPLCRPRAGIDGGNRKNKEANPSCDSRNSMWRFEDSPSTADIVISWLAQTNDTELSIGRLTDQDLSNEHAESSSKHHVQSEDELCIGRSNEENLKQKSTTGIVSRNEAGKSKTEEVKTDPLGERVKTRKRVRAVEKEALKAINDMGPAWWLKQVETQGSHFPTVQKNVRPTKAQGKDETTKGPGQKTTKSIMRGRGISRDRSAWPQVTESKITAWKRAARKRVEPISDQYPSSQGPNTVSVTDNDVGTGEGNPPTRFEQVSSQHKITPNKSLSKFGNKDMRFKDDTLERSDKRIRYRGSHSMLPAQSARHGNSKQSASLQFFSKSDSAAGNAHGPSGKDQTDHRHAARNVTENNNRKGFRLDLTKAREMTNEDEFLNISGASSFPQCLSYVNWSSAVASSISNLEAALRGLPHGVWGGSQKSQLGSGRSKSEASTTTCVVSLDWYKPLTAPVGSTSLTGEVSKSDMTHSDFLDSFHSVSQAVSRSQSPRLVSISSSETCSTFDRKHVRDKLSNECEYSLVDGKLIPENGGGKNQEESNAEEETKRENNFIEAPVSPVCNWGYRTSPFEQLLVDWDGTTNCCNVDVYSDVCSEKSPKSPKENVCGVKGSVKRLSVCSSASSGDESTLPTLGHALKLNLAINTGREEEEELEGLTDRKESLFLPLELTRRENTRLGADVDGNDRGQRFSRAEDGCRGDCDKTTRDETDPPFDHSTSRGPDDGADVTSRNNVDTRVTDYYHTPDTESPTNQLASPEISDSDSCGTSQSTLDHTPEPSSCCDVTLSSSQESPVKPGLCGFSYLYNHRTATLDSPTEARSSSCRPVLLRVRPPKANSMVGQLVKMFENRLKFRRRPDVTY